MTMTLAPEIDWETISDEPMQPHNCGKPGGCIPFATDEEPTRKWPAKELANEVEFLLSCGESAWAIATSLRLKLESLERACQRANRPDLAAIFWAQRNPPVDE